MVWKSQLGAGLLEMASVSGTGNGTLENIENIENIENLESNLEALQDVEASQVMAYFESKIPVVVDFMVMVLIALVFTFIGVKLIKLLRRFVRGWLERSHVDKGVVQFADAFVKVIAYILLFMMVISVMGIETTSFIAAFGSAGLAVGMALQGSLANFAGGVLILGLKPFGVGDYIVTGTDEGTVSEISLFSTKLLTLDNLAVIIPNGTLANSTVTNVTTEDYRKLDLKVGIGYQSDLKLAKSILQRLLDEEEAVLKDRPVQVFVDELGDSAVVLGMRSWVKTEDYWNTRWDLNERIKLSFDEAGIEIPYNQLDVHVHGAFGGAGRAGEPADSAPDNSSDSALDNTL